MTRELRPTVPSAWPVLLALGLLALLLVAMLGVDLFVAGRVARRTDEIVLNGQRSVELVDDLRAQSYRLSKPNLSEAEQEDIAERIAADAVAYEPIANNPGEREEWERLQQALHLVQHRDGQQKAPDYAALDAQISASVDRIIVINRQSSHEQSRAIRAVHQRAILADASAGLIAVAIMGTVAGLLLRVLRRQRAFVRRNIELLGERNRELDAFAGRAAHDLRLPLSPIRGYADLLATGEEPREEVVQMASRIRTSVDRMARIIDDMLELSRAGRPAAGRTEVRNVVVQVLEELGPELKSAEVKTTLTDGLVGCAPGVLEQILRNLLINAVKFRDRHRPLLIEVVVTRDAEAVELSVKDNGVGMEAESAEHAFEPYYRGRPDREIPGHGLGLAIVERATSALGGSCKLSSEPDHGTHISVRLPRADLPSA